MLGNGNVSLQVHFLLLLQLVLVLISGEMDCGAVQFCGAETQLQHVEL